MNKLAPVAPNPTTTTETFSHDEPTRDDEDEPLIANADSPSAARPVEDAELGRQEGRRGDNIAQKAAFGAIGVFLLVTWYIVLSNHPVALGWFFWHPMLQTLSISVFTYGILTLQPTSRPATKAAGLSRHQIAMLCCGFPAILLGALAIWWNKTLHDAPHATTWHATCGYIALSWIIVQVFIGGGSVWFDGRMLGGNPKAKLMWKYHRLSGYLLFPLLLLTAHLAGAWSDWVTLNSPHFLRIIAYTVAPLVLLIAVLARVRLSKMKII